MIVVTGTKRSGTSMWMQILQAAGVPSVGEAFSKTWKDTIGDANKRGFFESRFRRGIYHASNPHHETGKWLNPRKSTHQGIKIFIPGVIRTDVLYLNRVIGSVRPFRQYASSLARLYAMEKEGHERRGTGATLSEHLDPILEWWVENFFLLRDITTRQYPARLVSYESMLEDPEGICVTVFSWLQVGNAHAAKEAVHPEDRTQAEDKDPQISHRFEGVFDEYHHRVKNAVPFDATFLSKMNETHQAIIPELEAALSDLRLRNAKVREIRAKRAKERAADENEAPRRRKGKDPLNLDRLNSLLHPRGRHMLE